MNRTRTILTALALLTASATMHAQLAPVGLEPAQIYFRAGSAQLDTTYRDNGKTISNLVGVINEALSVEGITIESINITTGASPEGGADYNERLAMERAKSIRKYLLDNLALNASQVKAWSVGADWEGLVTAVRKSSCQWKDEILYAIYDTNVRAASDDKTKERCVARLKGIDDGKAWAWLKENIFADLRQGAGTIQCVFANSRQANPARDTIVIIHEYDGTSSLQMAQIAMEKADSTAMSVLKSLEKKPRRYSKDTLYRTPLLALRSNLLVPAMNVGVEMPLDNRWSVSADWYFPWVWRPIANSLFEPQSSCLQLLGGTVGGRYWLGVNHENKDEYTRYRLRGHSISLNIGGGYYDFQYDWNGVQGEYAIAGIGYMYALPLGKGNVHIEFEIGAGYAISRYRRYQVHEPNGRLIGNWDDGTWHGPVPVKAGVNMVFPIFTKDKR